jgi:hypothetical protein
MATILAPPYNQYQSYKAGEYIVFNGSNTYICLKDAEKQQSPTTASLKWQQVFNSGALSPSGVTAGTYGDSTNVGQFTVDANGIITSAVDVPIAGIGAPAALTKTDDTNVTLTLGGTPATSLLQAVSLILGWTGTLADARIASAATWNAKAPLASPTFTGTVTAPTINVSGLTASEIVATDGSKNLQSLAVATYPSLAELAFVKGVTSAIQTQLNAITSANNVLRTYQALGSGLVAQTCGLSADRITTSGATIADGYVTFIALEYLRVAQTITGVKWWQSIIGNYTSNNNNKVGLYSYSGGTLTLVASSADDGTLWKTFASGSLGNKAFSASYAAAAGQYYVGLIYNQSAVVTAPTLGVAANMVNAAVQSLDFTNSAKLQGIITGQTDLPATQAMSGVTAIVNQTWVGVY